MHLLVTRPEPDAAATAGRLRAMGHAATVAPLLGIVFDAAPAAAPDPAAILLTSRNGLRALLRWPQAAGWHDRIVLAAGQATAAAAREAGFRDVRPGGGDGAALAALVRASLRPGAGPILYPAARDRAGGLADGLVAAGYDLNVVEAYRAEPAARLSPATKSLLVTGAIGGVLIYSRRTGEAFRSVVAADGLDAAAKDLALFAISRQAAEPLAGLGATIHVAAEPTEDSLFSLLPPAG
jgi:uroporphyrinogen-III synthase